MQILNEIENKDITITPISKQPSINLKKRKASDTIIITSNTQLVPPSPTPTTVSVPITITRSKDDHQQVDELINIKLEPFEELLTSSTQLRSSADITVQEILDWAKTFKIPQSAVNELLQILKIKRIKTEIKSEPKLSDGGAATSSLQQRKRLKHFISFSRSSDTEKHQLKLNNLFSSFIPPHRVPRHVSSAPSSRNCRSLLENLPALGGHGAQPPQSHDDARAESRHEKPPATENTEHKPAVAAAEMRFSPAGDNSTEARADPTSLQNREEGLRKEKSIFVKNGFSCEIKIL